MGAATPQIWNKNCAKLLKLAVGTADHTPLVGIIIFSKK
jgi:hypothetical protein